MLIQVEEDFRQSKDPVAQEKLKKRYNELNLLYSDIAENTCRKIVEYGQQHESVYQGSTFFK
jgi:hypothetical protein